MRWLSTRKALLIVMGVLLAIPLMSHHVISNTQALLGTETPDLLTELRGTDSATMEATSALNLDDLRDANGKPFPQPIEDRGTLNNGQAANEDPGTERKSYLYHVDAKAGDHLSFSMIGSPKLQPILALVDGSTGKPLKIATVNNGGVMALLDYDVDKDNSFLIVASYIGDNYGTSGGAAFILTYTLFQGTSSGVSVASGFVTATIAPTSTLTLTPIPTDTPVPSITPRATVTHAPTGTPIPTSNSNQLPNGITPAGDITAGDTKSGTVDDNTPILAYRFQAKAGQHVQITMQADQTLQPSLALAYGAGLDPRSAVRPRNGESKLTLDFDITQDGTYYIVATRVGADRGGSSGNFTLKLQVSLTGSVEAALPQVLET